MINSDYQKRNKAALSASKNPVAPGRPRRVRPVVQSPVSPVLPSAEPEAAPKATRSRSNNITSGRQHASAINTRNKARVDVCRDNSPELEILTPTPPLQNRVRHQETSEDCTAKKFQELFGLIADLGKRIDSCNKQPTKVQFFVVLNFLMKLVVLTGGTCARHTEAREQSESQFVGIFIGVHLFPFYAIQQDDYQKEIDSTPNGNGKSGDIHPENKQDCRGSTQTNAKANPNGSNPEQTSDQARLTRPNNIKNGRYFFLFIAHVH